MIADAFSFSIDRVEITPNWIAIGTVAAVILLAVVLYAIFRGKGG